MLLISGQPGRCALPRTPALDTRVQGSDERFRARCLQHPEEILAFSWLRVCEGQLFATVLDHTQQEVTMVPVTEGVATCWARKICPLRLAPCSLWVFPSASVSQLAPLGKVSVFRRLPLLMLGPWPPPT